MKKNYCDILSTNYNNKDYTNPQGDLVIKPKTGGCWKKNIEKEKKEKYNNNNNKFGK